MPHKATFGKTAMPSRKVKELIPSVWPLMDYKTTLRHPPRVFYVEKGSSTGDVPKGEWSPGSPLIPPNSDHV
jgi:hypothetical protein